MFPIDVATILALNSTSFVILVSKVWHNVVIVGSLCLCFVDIMFHVHVVAS